MSLRNAVLRLIPRHYYRTSVQRQIRCCGVLLTKPAKKEGLFQNMREEMERWKIESEKGKTLSQFVKESDERKSKKMEENRKSKNDDSLSKIEDSESKNEIKWSILDGVKKRYPRTTELYFRVKDGLWNLMNDFKEMAKLHFRLTRGGDVRDFTLQELQLLYEGIGYVKKMLPMLFFAILPFGNFVVLFVAYTRPTRFLTPHFWTEEQKLSHSKIVLASRVSVFLPIIQYLEMKLPEDNPSPVHLKFREVLTSIQDGRVPKSSELLACKELFSDHNLYCIDRFPASHLDDLLILHDRKGFFVKKLVMEEWVTYLHLVDVRIELEGGVPGLSTDWLKTFCFQRGVNPDAMTEREMREYLNQWIAFSKQVSSSHVSLLLHAPALFGFNHKSNYLVTDESASQT